MASKKQSKKRNHPPVQRSGQRKTVIHFPTENRPLLSIGMIFRDDIRCIERCLQALQPLRDAVPCQLVMADTGSVDGSRAVAERYADLVIDFPWIGDFSAARNAVMDRCSGVWYMTVDTDEYLDADFSQLVDFLQDKNSMQYDYAFVTVRNYQSEDMLDGDYGDFSAGRIVRMELGMRYFGAIHESWAIKSEQQICELLHVIFHHDGYCTEKLSKKQKRNMPLLKQALEQDLGNMTRILQCIESCYTKEDAWKYSKMAVDLAEEFQKTYPAPDREHILAAALRGAITKAANFGFHELEEWVALARCLVPDSILIGTDVSFHYCSYLSGAGKSERCLEELTGYWAALGRFDAGDFDTAELRITIVNCTSSYARHGARMFQADALVNLKRWDEVVQTLSLLPLNEVTDTKIMFAALVYLFRTWRESDIDCFPLFLRNLESIERDDSKLSYQRREAFFAACRDAFGEEEADDHAVKRKAYQLFLQLDATCDLGRAARIMESHDPEAVRSLLSGVAEWKFFPTEAINRALTLGVLLPEEFYRQKTEVLNFHAAKLISLWEKDTLSLLELWDEQLPSELTAHQVMWLFYLTASAVQKRKWKRNGSDVLFDRFGEKTALYLDTFCRPELCTEEFIQLQPPLVRFGWYCMQAGNAWDANDPLAYTRWLKKALRADPEMRDMVEFLSKRAKKLTETQMPVSPELLALANQVRMILAAYPADHPAVLAIKQSEAYQQVAYLLT